MIISTEQLVIVQSYCETIKETVNEIELQVNQLEGDNEEPLALIVFYNKTKDLWEYDDEFRDIVHHILAYDEHSQERPLEEDYLN